MKKTLLPGLIAICFLVSCRKTDFSQISTNSYVASVQRFVKDSLSVADYQSLDFTRARQIHVDSVQLHMLQIPLVGKQIKNEFLLVQTNAEGKTERARFIIIAGNMVGAGPAAPSFNGKVAYRCVSSNSWEQENIVNGIIVRDGPVLSAAAAFNEAPTVIAYGTYIGNVISWGTWYSFASLLGDNNIGVWENYYASDGGGGGGNSEFVETPVLVDFEYPEDAEAIDVDKYADCFANVPDAGASFSITINADVPVDSDPSKLFNFTEASFGHAFLTLKKTSASGTSVTQNVGFYPNSAWKVLGAAEVESKMVDNGFHEYNAKYTVTVTAGQFSTALSAMKAASERSYSIGSFNCTDFSMYVFNAGGGNLTIPTHPIPGSGGSSSGTPQGLYGKIKELSDGGNVNAMANNSKNYAGISHGPCN